MFYIYQHVRNDNGQIFYVGKGQGNRAKQTQGRNPYWNRVVKKAKGFTIDYFKTDIKDESKAYEIEKSCIAELKNQGVELTNLSEGGEGFGSGENHPSYGKNRSDYDNAKVRLGHLRSSNGANVSTKFARGRTLTFKVRGGRNYDGHQIELGQFRMQHEAIAKAKAERGRLESELMRYIFEKDNGLELSKTYEDICPKHKKLSPEVLRLIQQRSILKRSLDKEILLELEEQLRELDPTLQSGRTYEEELDVQYFLADKYRQEGDDYLYERALENIISLEKDQFKH